MADRHRDWLRQAEADLQAAAGSMEGGHHEWACFAAHQAAEKAVKALFLSRGLDAWGHTVSALLGSLAQAGIRVPTVIVDDGKQLDKHYIPTRYPNGFDSGAPTDFYTRADAEAAIAAGGRIVEFCTSHLA